MGSEKISAEINCKCGKCGITLADGKAQLKFKCGCQDCRQALEWGHSRGAIKPDPLPDLLYMPSDIIDVRGKDFMQSYQLRNDDPSLLGMSRRIYCTECYSIIGVDHPAYEDNVFLNFGTSKQEKIVSITKNKLEKYFNNGEFQKGSIGPKIKAAIHFLKYQGERVIITSIPCIKKALDGNAGTTIRNEA